jgi:hypothetical protein
VQCSPLTLGLLNGSARSKLNAPQSFKVVAVSLGKVQDKQV